MRRLYSLTLIFIFFAQNVDLKIGSKVSIPLKISINIFNIKRKMKICLKARFKSFIKDITVLRWSIIQIPYPHKYLGNIN